MEKKETSPRHDDQKSVTISELRKFLESDIPLNAEAEQALMEALVDGAYRRITGTEQWTKAKKRAVEAEQLLARIRKERQERLANPLPGSGESSKLSDYEQGK